MKKSVFLQLFFGFLILLVGVVNFRPFLLGMNIGSTILIYGVFILGAALLLLSYCSLSTVPFFEGLSRINKMTLITIVPMVISAVVIFYLQMMGIGFSWLHVLFGIGLLSYSVGQIALNLLEKERPIGLRAFNSAISVVTGVLSVIVLIYSEIPNPFGSNITVKTSSGNSSVMVYLTYFVFVDIALMLIGIGLLLSPMIGSLLKKNKQC